MLLYSLVANVDLYSKTSYYNYTVKTTFLSIRPYIQPSDFNDHCTTSLMRENPIARDSAKDSALAIRQS